MTRVFEELRVTYQRSYHKPIVNGKRLGDEQSNIEPEGDRRICQRKKRRTRNDELVAIEIVWIHDECSKIAQVKSLNSARDRWILKSRRTPCIKLLGLGHHNLIKTRAPSSPRARRDHSTTWERSNHTSCPRKSDLES